MSVNQETKETISLPEVSEATNSLSAKILPALSVDAEGTLAVDGDVFGSVLPDFGVDLETVEKVQVLESAFATAALDAFGVHAVKHLAENADSKRVAGLIQTGKNTLALNITRPTGKKSDGTWKDPAVTAVTRRYEADDHASVRNKIYVATRSIMD